MAKLFGHFARYLHPKDKKKTKKLKTKGGRKRSVTKLRTVIFILIVPHSLFSNFWTVSRNRLLRGHLVAPARAGVPWWRNLGSFKITEETTNTTGCSNCECESECDWYILYFWSVATVDEAQTGSANHPRRKNGPETRDQRPDTRMKVYVWREDRGHRGTRHVFTE